MKKTAQDTAFTIFHLSFNGSQINFSLFLTLSSTYLSPLFFSSPSPSPSLLIDLFRYFLSSSKTSIGNFNRISFVWLSEKKEKWERTRVKENEGESESESVVRVYNKQISDRSIGGWTFNTLPSKSFCQLCEFVRNWVYCDRTYWTLWLKEKFQFLFYYRNAPVSLIVINNNNNLLCEILDFDNY